MKAYHIIVAIVIACINLTGADNLTDQMKRIEINKDIDVYLSYKDGRKYACNYTVIKNGSEALFIDTGYSTETERLLEKLAGEGLNVKTVILSHAHEDHVEGNRLFPQAKFYASEFYETDLDTSLESIKDFKADSLIKGGESFSFGDHSIEFLYSPGHAKSGITTIIDGKIFHVGDLVWSAADDLLAIPYIGEDIDNFINSLERIQGASPEILLLGHGKPIIGSENINAAISRLLYYLNTLKNADKSIKVEDCIIGNIEEYGYPSLHLNNIKNLKIRD